MTHTHHRNRSATRDRETRISKRSTRGPKRHRRPWFEALEPRLLLDGGAGYDAVTPAWFAEVAGAAPEPEGAVYGPLTATAGAGSGGWQSSAEVAEWIVRLTESATEQAGSVAGVKPLLDRGSVAFDVVRGLGLPGQVLVRSAAPDDQVRAALAGNANVGAFEGDAYVFAQQLPDDPDFPSMTSLHNVGQFGSTPEADIDAPEAWDVNTGSTNVVVGVIDSGIDVTHPDLYLNVWLNQGEIPEPIRPKDGSPGRLTDVDYDGRITFYDLNDPGNVALVRDLNGNHRIEALDLLADPRWADGVDTDKNGFVDDFCGWNFRAADDEPFAANDPRDVLGHGTHVAGTIGAIGNNGVGVTGINWRSSLMALKFLDAGNRGLTSEAVLAVNYATMMRRSLDENVRVLNASWGQSGGASVALHTSIEAAGQAGMLFVAAAGNGNILGEGIDIDRNALYPASYALDNVIAVAASGPHDELAPFSNYGATSVDLAAPGIGVLSTFPGGRYGTSNGTSMAAPHVSGAAALIWSEIPDATISEVRQAILAGAEPLTALEGRVSSSARLNANGALTASTFLPRATLIVPPDITAAGGSYQDLTVEYQDNHGIDLKTMDDSDLVIAHLMGPGETLIATFESAQRLDGGKRYRATYRLTAPGGVWDALDFGEYLVFLNDDQVHNVIGLAAEGRPLGSFRVRISDPSVLVVDSREDAPDILPGDGLSRDALGRSTLRAAVQEANAAGGPRTIFLEPGRYNLTQRGSDEDQAAAGDLDITGELTIVGAGPGKTIIDAGSIDRVLDVLAGGVLTLAHVTVMGGHLTGPAGDCGGGIRNRGTLTSENTVLANNFAGAGGGLCNLGSGTATINRSTIAENTAYDNGEGDPRYGGGIDNRDNAQLTIHESSLQQNRLDTRSSRGGGGGIANAPGGSVSVTGSAIWGNSTSPGTTGGGIFNDGTFQISNSTISGNTVVNQSWAASASSAGAYNRGALTATGVTISNNTARAEGGITNAGGVVSMANSLIAGNVGGEHPDVAGVFLSQGHNLVGDASGATGFAAPGDLADANAAQFLGPLQDNGGPTLTHALLPGSPAIDAGSNDAELATDQRGVTRPWDGNADGTDTTDIGAFEAYQGEIRGTRFEDLDGDHLRDPDEPGRVGLTVYLDNDGNGRLDPGEAWTLTQADDPATNGVSEAGTYVFAGLAPGSYRIAEVLEPKWNQTVAGWSGIRRVSSAAGGSQSNGQSMPGAVSADGRYVVFTSDATNLVPGVESGFHLYLYHQQTGTIEHLAKVYNQLPSEPWVTYADISADGRYVAFYSSSGLVPGDTNDHGDVFVYDRLAKPPASPLQRVSIGADGAQGNGESYAPAISADGRFVAFVSAASNLVPGDTNNADDVFLYDLRDRKIERISQGHDGSPGDGPSSAGQRPSVSEDGRYVAFASDASNLVPDDENECSDIFVFDRDAQSTTPMTRVSVDRDGAEADFASVHPDLSADGRLVAFQSGASNLVAGNGKNIYNVFVYHRDIGEPQLVSQSLDGSAGTEPSRYPAISADGRYVAFSSQANLVPGDTLTSDVFVYDRQTGILERASVDADAAPGNDHSFAPLLSADGGYVAFQSYASNFVRGETESSSDVFVRATLGMEQRVSQLVDVRVGEVVRGIDFGNRRQRGAIEGVVFRDEDGDGVRTPDDSPLAGWTVFLDSNANGIPDGRTFSSFRPTDIPGWATATSRLSIENVDQAVSDIDVTVQIACLQASDLSAVLISPQGTRVSLFAHVESSLSNFNGTTFDDEALEPVNAGRGPFRGSYRPQVPLSAVDGEAANGAWTLEIYNRSGSSATLHRWSLSVSTSGLPPEPQAVTDDAGRYRFDGLSPDATYPVVLVLQDGWQQTAPGPGEGYPWMVYVDAGSVIGNRDFGARPGLTQGQSQNAKVSGRLFVDANHNGRWDGGEATLPGCTVFLDLNDNGNRDLDEPQMETDETGQYSFGNLGNRPYTVRVREVPHYLQTAPIGNSFARSEYSLAAPGNELGNPRDVALGDFNGDGWLDLATAVYGRNSVTVLLNDQHGGFSQPLIEIPLAPADRHKTKPRGLGPFALVAGQFNGSGGMDLAVVNSLSSNVAILLDFDGQHFSSEEYVNVGLVPFAIAGADLDGDGDLDLIVTNDLVADGTTKNLSVLRNDGMGAFAADAGPLAAGNKPRSVVTGDFNEDGRPDFAVADFGMHPSGTDLGDVRVLLADGGGSFASQLACPVGSGPRALTAADLNGDNHLDLAVANFLSNNVTVCLGAGNGEFQATATLSGGMGPVDIAATDVDEDGDLDLLVTSATSDTASISILRNRSTLGQLAFDPAETFGAGDWKLPAHVSLAVGDLDRNGNVDLAVAISGANQAAVHLNALAGGAQRIALTGTETVTGVDFGFQPVSAPLTVSVNQASGQQDPTNALPVHFTVLFSEAVSDFAAEDVTLSGTAPGTLVAVVSGSGTTYDVAVSGMTNTGTVIASLAAGAAHSAAGHPNQTAVILDNQISYTPWHNALSPVDVNGNGAVEPLDALVLINYINAHSGELELPAPPTGPHPYYDVNNDRACTANDALMVINRLNGDTSGAEGEGPEAAAQPPFVDFPTAKLMAAFALSRTDAARNVPCPGASGEPNGRNVETGLKRREHAQGFFFVRIPDDAQTGPGLTRVCAATRPASAAADALDAFEFDQLLTDLARDLARLP